MDLVQRVHYLGEEHRMRVSNDYIVTKLSHICSTLVACSTLIIIIITCRIIDTVPVIQEVGLHAPVSY